MTGEWLAFCGTCPVPEIANVFRRSGIPFHPITGTLEDDPDCWNEVDDWIAAAKVVSGMFHNRLGIMGHYYGGMLDIYTDLTLQCSTFGGHMEILEVDELVALRRVVGASEAKERVSLFQDSFYIQPDCSEEELEKAARTSVALDRLVERHALGSMAYYLFSPEERRCGLILKRSGSFCQQEQMN